MRPASRLLGYACALVSSALVATLLVVVGVDLGREQGAPETARTKPAVAGSTYLCTGYSGCRNAGYSDAGYGARNDRMYWRMYSGHNCTNYVAYRMIRAGMSAERPWSGSGMAYNWGHAMSRITDATPTVGAVAWWDRYDNGTGSSGHVAYVERVVSATEIIVSQDSWGGDFSWRRITKSSGRWPTGFIHFVDKTIKNTAVPTIAGTPQVGTPLTVRPGTWQPAATLSYQWRANGAAIAGATAATYTPTVAQRRMKISVTVTARKSGYTTTQLTTPPTAEVAPGAFVVGSPTQLTGTPEVDQVLTATPATVTPAATTTEYVWRADGVLIEGATGRTLTLTRALVGKRIHVTTVVRREGYRVARSASPRTEPVVVGQIEVQTPYTVQGRTHVGQPLTLNPGTFTPTDARPAYQWLRDGTPIAGATAATYTLTAADAGHRVALRVTLTRATYANRVETVAAPGAVTTTPTVSVNATGKSRSASMWVKVTAPGVAPVAGQVTIRIGQQVVRKSLANGRVWVWMGSLPVGRRTVRVEYAGRGPVLPGRGTDRITVKP